MISDALTALFQFEWGSEIASNLAVREAWLDFILRVLRFLADGSVVAAHFGGMASRRTDIEVIAETESGW